MINAVRDSVAEVPATLPNYPLTDYPETGVWVAIHNIPVSSLPVTIGPHGEDEHIGIIQVDINQRKGSGSGDIFDIVDRIAGIFTNGTHVHYTGGLCRVKSSSLTPAREFGGWYRVSLSITYYSRTSRN